MHFLSSNTSPKNIWVTHLIGKWLWFYMTLWLWEWERFQVLASSFSYLLMKWFQLTTIDGWGIHAYVLEKWKWMPILFTLEKVTTCVTIANLTPSVVACSLEFCNVDKCLNSGLKVNVTWDWWGSMFTSVHNGITIHIKHNVIFYARSLLCMPNSLACEDFIYLIIG